MIYLNLSFDVNSFLRSVTSLSFPPRIEGTRNRRMTRNFIIRGFPLSGGNGLVSPTPFFPFPKVGLLPGFIIRLDRSSYSYSME